MPTKPYQMMRKISESVVPGQTAMWRLEMDLSDTPNVSAQRERLIIVTQISGPLPTHPQALELAALLHVRSLLSEQIEAMQSP
jgi:hypothetical protein